MQNARKQSLRVSQDPAVKEILDWIEAASDTEGWTWEDGGSQIVKTAIKIAMDAYKGQESFPPFFLDPSAPQPVSFEFQTNPVISNFIRHYPGRKI